MKATHRQRGVEDRVFHLVDGTSTVFVNIDGRGWKRSAWSGDNRLFNSVMTRVSTFKGNK